VRSGREGWASDCDGIGITALLTVVVTVMVKWQTTFWTSP
jgi:hypothetical protein